MSSLEKRHTGRRGSTHGHHKCSDGFSDTLSVGSLMDETDREVSNLTDRAFRSLCIGEDAIYNDLEVSTPTECQTAFVQEGEQKKDLKLTHQENASHGVQYSTFQHSCLDVAQEQGLRDESLAYVSNGSIEATYQQRRSSSRVSSLIKAFSDNGAPDVQHSKDKYKDDSWDKSALLSIQRELSEFSSAYHQNFKSYGNHYHQETTSLMTSSKIKFKSLNYTNFFCHSEFSPFQLWKDYNRFPFEREQASGFISASDFPRWYNSPLYKELTASHRISASPFESRQLDHRQIEDIASSQHSRFTVIQKASAIEKRCESELASNCPPWKRNNNLVRNKLPSNRPSTVSPTNEKAHRPDSSLLYYSKNTYDMQQQVRKVSSSEISSSSTPFNITQLLTPVIHKRQDTETSEILQLAHTPLVPDYSPQRETDRKSLPDVKQLRDSYKSKAPSLLFNLKDNRKRVKSTYSPPKFKGLELSDRNRQSSKLEDLESRLADTALFKENQQEQYVGSDPLENCNSVLKTVEHTEYANRTYNNMTLISHYGPSKHNAPYADSQDTSVHPDKLSNKENDQYRYEPHINSPLRNRSGSLDAERTIDALSPGIRNHFFNAHPTKQQLAPVSEKHIYSRREDAGYHSLKEENHLRKQGFGYIKHQVTEEKFSGQEMRPVVTPSKDTFKGEIAALIEMDKQRKATAKQYLPSANETCTMRKETYINKVNESIKQGWFPKVNENHTTSMEDKRQMNEGSVTYQPYKYDPNKKWYIATTESRHTVDESGMSKEVFAPDNILEQQRKTSSTENLLKTSYIPQQATTYTVKTSQRNVIGQESVRTEEQRGRGQSVQNTNTSSKNYQTREGRFNINDILFIRDNEQAKRLREKCSPNASVTDPTKLQHLTSPVISDIADNKAIPSKVKQEQTPQDQNSHYKPENANISPGNITKDLQEVLSKENDKISRRARGQTKQEILTSKLKAHAQKEISAIKEKGLAKQNIPSRNHVKQSTTVNNEKGQINQVESLKKEITAEKLNHLFQDITYSSVSLNNDEISPKYESVQNSEVRLSKRDRKSPCIVAVTDKNKESMIYVEKDMLQNQATEPTQDKVTVGEMKKYQVQTNDQPHVQSNENLPSRSSRYNHKELSSNGTLNVNEDRSIPDKPLLSSLVPNFVSKEKYVVKTEAQTSNLLTMHSANNTEHLKPAIKKRDSPNHDTFVTPLTSHKQPGNILKQAEHLDQNISQTNVRPQYRNSNTEITRLTEKTLNQESQSNAKKEASKNLATAKHHEIIKSPTDWTKSKDEKEAASVKSTEGFTANTSGQHTKHTTNPLKDKEGFKSEVNDHISNNQEKTSSKISVQKVSDQVYAKNNPQDKDKDVEPQTGSTAKTNEDCFVQQLNDKTTENIHKNKKSGCKTSKSNMEERLKPASSDENSYSLLQEVKTKACEVSQNVLSLKLKDRDAKDLNDQTKMSDTVTNFNKKYQLQPQQERTNLSEMAKDHHKETEKTSAIKTEKHSNKDSKKTNRSGSESIITNNKELGKTISTPNITKNNTDQQISSSDSDISADIVKPESESHIIHIASKEDSAQANEPIIYNICVSSTTDVITEDEPVIFSISISSLSDTSATQDSINQNKSNSGQALVSVEQVEKDEQDKNEREAGKILKEQVKTEEETLGGIKEETQKECPENKTDNSKNTEVPEAEQETVKRKCDSPESKHKPDCNGSTELDNISLAYEKLLVKYGLRNSDIVLKSGQEQEPTHVNTEVKPTCNHSPKLQHHTRDDHDHESREKLLASVDINTKHAQELGKANSPKEATKISKQEENIKEGVMPLIKKNHTVNSNEEGVERTVGQMGNFEKQNKEPLNAENKIKDSDILVNKTVLNCAPTSENNLNIRSTVASKPDTTKVKLEENKQVRREGQTIQKELKKIGDERALHKNVENEIVQVKYKNDKQLLPVINPDDTSERSTVTGNSLHDNSPHFNSKIYVTYPEETKTKVRGQDKRVPDVPLIQNSQISSNQRINTADSKLQYRTQEKCVRDAFNLEKPSKDPDLTKDNKASQNNRTDTICNKKSLEQEQSKFMIGKEIKHIRNEPSTVAYKQIKGTVDCSGNENVITNVSVAQNTHQGVLPVSKLDKQILQNSSVNVQNKMYNPKATADLPKNAEKNATSIPSKTKDSTQRSENEKGKSKESKNEKNELGTVHKENALRALPLNKTEKVAECEFTKSVNRKETTAKPQDENKPCYDRPAMTNTDQAKKDSGQRTDVRANKDEHSANINVYQYHPLKGFIPEIKENRHDQVSSAGSNHDTVLKKQEGTLIKTKDTQNERKAIKPEISALADYARLKVISAEADSNTEKDILLNMNTNHKYNLSVGEPQNRPTEQIKKTTANKYESKSETTMPSQVHERHNHTFKKDKIKEGLLEGHSECPPRDKIIPHPKSRSLTKSSDDGQLAVKNRDISRAGYAESNTATHLNEKCYEEPNNHKMNPTQNTHVAQNSVLQVEVKSKNDALPKLKQPVHVKIIGKDVNTESSSQSSMDSIHNNKINIQEDRRAHVVPPEMKDGELTEELQYYIVNALEKEPKPKVTHEPVPLRQNADSKKAPEIPATGPRSNTSSPAMGKPIMFKVKDNTNKTSSVTKTVRPRFHRSFSQECRVSSPNEVWCGAEKNRFDQDRQHDPKVPANHSVLHEPSVALYRVPKAKEIQSRNNLFSPGAKELKSYNTRSQVVEDDTSSVISTMSEDVESRAASTVIMADATTSQGFDIDRRNTFARPESSCYERPESVCYERPESVCYERPESACSDMRSMSKPPVVPPKTEKALRRAQKLTTRRIKKTEVKMASDTQGKTETMPIRNVSSMPSSPMEHTVTHQPAQASPPISHYHVQPNYASPAPSLMAHSFPITQRKLLQDPNSGQYFMVDMPMQVKTKTFFDPETGKYLQLNVRQNPQSTQSTPVEVLGHSYVVYPGFLPMSVSVSSVPSLRSSSRMSAPATLQEEQNKLEAGREPSEPENYQIEDHRNVQQHNVPMYGTHEQKMHSGNNVRLTPRRTHIITMSELEDFAFENT